MIRTPIHFEINRFAHGAVQPRPFRRRRTRRMVAGGRWSIRKFEIRHPIGNAAEKPWRAWSEGKARPFSRWFRTQAEASAWAHDIAATFNPRVLPPDMGRVVRADMIKTLVAADGNYTEEERWLTLSI